MKFSHIKAKLLLTAAYFAILALWWLLELPSCIWAFFLGIPCPGCGMTRACLAALRLDFMTAFSFHPMFWSMPLLYLYFLTDNGVFRKKWINRLVLSVIAFGFLVTWVEKIILFFVE